MSSIHKRQAAARSFESVLNPENKATIERILDSVDSSSCYSGNQAFSSLALILGKDSALFLLNMMEAYRADDFIEDLKDVSEETKKYVAFLYSVYAYKLRGVLSGGLSRYPDEWISIQKVSSKYDIRSRAFCVKFQIQKNNKECVTIEDSVSNIVYLATLLLREVADVPSSCPEVQKDLGVSKKAIDELRATCERLGKAASKDAKNAQ